MCVQRMPSMGSEVMYSPEGKEAWWPWAVAWWERVRRRRRVVMREVEGVGWRGDNAIVKGRVVWPGVVEVVDV